MDGREISIHPDGSILSIKKHNWILQVPNIPAPAEPEMDDFSIFPFLALFANSTAF
jgi:hypothetical protein